MFVTHSKLSLLKPLFLDYVSAFESGESFGKLANLYAYNPSNPQAFQNRLDRLAALATHSGGWNYRDGVVEVLREQNAGFGADDRAFANIELLRCGNTAVVIAGQQAGLFGGPMYTLIKAIAAIRLARRFAETHSGWNVIPMFWIASDDHDFDEVKRFKWIGADNQEHHCEFTPKTNCDGFPVGSIEIDEGIAEAFDCFFSTNTATEFTPALREVLDDAYAPGATMSQAFGKYMAALLSKHGLVIADPTDMRLKALGAPVFARAIEMREAIFDDVRARDAMLEARGYHKQIGLPPDGTNLFVIVDGRREALRTDDGGFVTESGARFTLVELAKLIAEEPHRISPNVVLRPLYQDTLFPTVASIVGPSELAYYAQISGVYELFGMQPPVFLPRPSLTVIEHRIERILEETGMEWWECANERDEVMTRVLRANLPEALFDDIERFKSGMDLLARDVAIEPALQVALDKMVQGVANQCDGIEKKVRQEFKAKNRMWVERVDRAINLLFPAQGFQERFFGAAYFLNKYGFEFIDSMLNELDPDEIGHHYIVV
jgi:bacillithiol biosynthesis cysteine-adding enzyme BshC